MRSLIEKLTAINENRPTIGDGVYLEFGNLLQVDTEIMEISDDSITLLGDEKLFKVLESLNEIEEKHGSPYDRGSADSYYDRRPNPHKLVPNAHGGHDREKLTDPDEIEAYKKGYRENIGKKDYGESIEEGEVVPFKRPENRGDMQNLNAAKQIIRDMYWVGYMEETPDLPSLSEYKQELNKIGYSVNIKFNPQTQEDYAILTNRTTNERYTMDENDLIGESLYEAEYHGRKVPLGKPMRGDVKKFKVFVKDPKTGNVKKVNFGDKKMRIKKSNPKRRKSFRARHNCANPGPRTKARYWSCRKW